jgi:dihydroorotate dehydrogenase
MPLDPFRLARPVLHALDPEDAHELTLRALETGLVPGQPVVDEASLRVRLFGTTYRNPIGIAAGFDKNARVFDRLGAQGFGFVEVGGVTPRPQAGNPRPRVFRLPADRAVINRMGFPGEGADAVATRLRARTATTPLWVNLASNADSPAPLEDFVHLTRVFAPLAEVLTLDVSCPNTANGQVFLEPAALAELLAAARGVLGGATRPALVAKLSPDLDEPKLAALVATLVAGGIDGIVVSNTTLARPPLRDAAVARERGGLSGPPLFDASTRMLARVRALAGPGVTLVGVGGIASGEDAYAKIRAGASAVQLYTGLVYQGTALVTRIARDLAALLRRDGFATVADAVGADRPSAAR